MTQFDFTRRELLLGAGGVVAGGAVATVTGLSAYYLRKRGQRNYQAAASAVDAGVVTQTAWIITPEDEAALAKARADGDRLIESETFALEEGTDYYGGDLGEQRVNSLGDCVEACEADPDCQKFTYAVSTHPLADKRQMCWTKKARVSRTLRDQEGYISGRRR
ncbi:MAG: PAN domain-containing protein [Pseudomonadota bacterium]